MTIFQTGKGPVKKSLNRKGRSGFTLLELLFVIFILAMVVGFAVPKFNQMTTINLRSAARQLSGLVTFTFNRSVLTRKPYRLVLDFDSNSYWVEVYQGSSGLIPTDSNDAKAEKENNSDDEDEFGDESEKKQKKARGQFEKITGYLTKPGKLPQGVKVLKYLDDKHELSITSGTAQIYFYPTGEASGGALIIGTDNDTAVTLRINPITGKVTNYSGAVENFDAS